MAGLNPSKYYQGRYAICPECGARPCLCPKDAAAAEVAPEVANVRSILPPPSGNAIPFVIWDELIDRYELTIVQSGVLLFIVRRTHGYGHHAGDFIAIAEICRTLRISHTAVLGALNRLEECGLIVRSRRHEGGKKEYAVTHIRPILEP